MKLSGGLGVSGLVEASVLQLPTPALILLHLGPDLNVNIHDTPNDLCDIRSFLKKDFTTGLTLHSSTTISWIAKKSGADINFPLRVNHN